MRLLQLQVQSLSQHLNFMCEPQFTESGAGLTLRAKMCDTASFGAHHLLWSLGLWVGLILDVK